MAQKRKGIISTFDVVNVQLSISHLDPKTTRNSPTCGRKHVSNAGGSNASLEILNCMESSDMPAS